MICQECARILPDDSKCKCSTMIECSTCGIETQYDESGLCLHCWNKENHMSCDCEGECQ